MELCIPLGYSLFLLELLFVQFQLPLQGHDLVAASFLVPEQASEESLLRHRCIASVQFRFELLDPLAPFAMDDRKVTKGLNGNRLLQLQHPFDEPNGGSYIINGQVGPNAHSQVGYLFPLMPSPDPDFDLGIDSVDIQVAAVR